MTYDAPHQRVKKVSITPECTQGSHQTQCEAMEGACPAEERPCTGRSPSALRKGETAFLSSLCAFEMVGILRETTQAHFKPPAPTSKRYPFLVRCITPLRNTSTTREPSTRVLSVPGGTGWGTGPTYGLSPQIGTRDMLTVLLRETICRREFYRLKQIRKKPLFSFLLKKRMNMSHVTTPKKSRFNPPCRDT